MPASPTIAHGLDLKADIDLLGLRVGAGRRVEVVTEPIPDLEGVVVGQWDEIPGKRAHTTVSSLAHNKFLVTIGTMARFVVDTNRDRVLVWYRDDLPEVLRTTLLMSTPVALFLYTSGQIGLHSGAVEVDGRALLISGTGGSGKTTLTAAFHACGHRFLGEDLAAVAPTGSVHPAQAVFRLRRESAKLLGPTLEGVRQVWEADGQRYYEFERGGRGTGSPVPISAVVLLDWAESGPILDRLDPAIAIQAMWDKTFYLADGKGAETVLHQLGELVDSVPVYRLMRPRGLDRLGATVDLLASKLITGRHQA